MQRHNLFWSPSPGALGRGQKVKYQKISITKPISKIFKPNFVFSQMKDIKHIRRDFYSVAWVMPQGSDLWVLLVQIFPPEIQPDLVCELLTSMSHSTAQLLWSPPPWAPQAKYHQISITKSISKIFKLNFVCLLTNERHKSY